MRYELIVELEGGAEKIQVTPSNYRDKRVWLVKFQGAEYMLCCLLDEWMQRNEDDLTPAQVRRIGAAIELLGIDHNNDTLTDYRIGEIVNDRN